MPRLRPALEHLTAPAASATPVTGRATRGTPARLAVATLGAASLAGYSLDLHALFGAELRVLGIYVALFAIMFALYLVAAWIVLRRPSNDRLLLGLILGFGLAFRLAVLPGPVVLSSDVFRYLWDGRVQWAGVNPYRYPPSAEELRPLRDGVIHPNVNRPAKRTIYPPGAQAAFALVTGVVPGSVLAWRLFLLACEIATVVLLLSLLRTVGVSSLAVLLYAWSPLAVFEGVHAGHLDVAVLPPLLLALRCRQHGRMAAAGAVLGTAVLLKLYPAVLVLAWWRRGDWRLPLACGATVAAGYLPYLAGVGPGVLGFLPEYLGSAEDFNVGLRFFLTEAIGLHGEIARATVMLVLGGTLVALLLGVRRRLVESPHGIFDAGMAGAAAWLLLAPTSMYPWYAVWMLPFLTVSPAPAWLWFTGTVSLSYLAYAWQPAPFPLWARALEFVPLWVLLAWPRAASPDARSTQRPRLRARPSPRSRMAGSRE